MLCATCGSMNPGTVSRCGNCGALLAGVPNTLATHSPAQPWFAPIAHSPFSNEPLPQPSDQLPQLRPVGELLTFTPTTQPSTYDAPVTLVNRELADYPTHVHIPAIQPHTTPPGAWSSGSSDPNYHDWEQDESYAAMYQEPPASTPPYTPAYAGTRQSTWDQGENYIAAHQTPPVGQRLGNVYPGPINNLGQPQSSFGPTSGPLTGTELHPFVQPMSLWAFLGSIAVAALLLTALVFLNPDWATGALIAGIVTLIAAILLLIATGVRVALGLLVETNPYRRTQVISVALLVVLLFLASGIGITQQTGLHAMQARSLESQHNWSTAISEYQAAHESAPSSTDLARVYNEWGEDLSQQQHYADAIAHFTIVLQNYSQTNDQLARARIDVFATYLAWGDADTHSQDYAGATSHYDTLLGLNYCDPACQSQAKPKDAAAYAHLAEQQLGGQHFASAVSAFTVLTTSFASSPEAKQAQTHADYAKALWGLGQQQLNTTCADAVKTYQQLAQQFADTGQGQQAATALQQPVTVKGHFTTSLPSGARYNPTVALVQSLVVGIRQAQFPPLLHKAPLVKIQSDGSFTFASVPQGTYELVWSNDGTLHFYYANNGNSVLYTAQLGPLCTYDYGAINETIPTLR